MWRLLRAPGMDSELIAQTIHAVDGYMAPAPACRAGLLCRFLRTISSYCLYICENIDIVLV